VLPCLSVSAPCQEILEKQGSGDRNHVYFMNNFREQGGEFPPNVTREPVFFLLCFVGKQKKLPHLILTTDPWDFSDECKMTVVATVHINTSLFAGACSIFNVNHT